MSAYSRNPNMNVWEIATTQQVELKKVLNSLSDKYSTFNFKKADWVKNSFFVASFATYTTSVYVTVYSVKNGNEFEYCKFRISDHTQGFRASVTKNNEFEYSEFTAELLTAKIETLLNEAKA